jgi:cell division protein FtsB
MAAGFARTDRLEPQRVQFIEFRDDVRVSGPVIRFQEQVVGELGEIRSRLDGLTARVDRLETEVRSLRGEFSAFRDWATREFAEVHGELRELRRLSVAQSAELEQLSARVDRLEHRWNGMGGAQTESTA